MILDLGLIDYGEAYTAQKELVRLRKLGEIEDSFILAEHYPVFTIGRTGHIENLLDTEERLSEKGIKVLRVDRGGDITFHGPGQLVVYPIVDLKDRGSDLRRYLRDLEDFVIELLKEYSVRGQRLVGKTGVWVADHKIASIGIAASNWVTFHGVGLNINTDLEFFSMINPCGMKHVRMTSLAKIIGRKVAMSDVKKKVEELINADAVVA